MNIQPGTLHVNKRRIKRMTHLLVKNGCNFASFSLAMYIASMKGDEDIFPDLLCIMERTLCCITHIRNRINSGKRMDSEFAKLFYDMYAAGVNMRAFPNDINVYFTYTSLCETLKHIRQYTVSAQFNFYERAFVGCLFRPTFRAQIENILHMFQMNHISYKAICMHKDMPANLYIYTNMYPGTLDSLCMKLIENAEEALEYSEIFSHSYPFYLKFERGMPTPVEEQSEHSDESERDPYFFHSMFAHCIGSAECTDKMIAYVQCRIQSYYTSLEVLWLCLLFCGESKYQSFLYILSKVTMGSDMLSILMSLNESRDSFRVAQTSTRSKEAP
eukprot:2677525-Rhodomonas_salina.2